MLRSPLVWLVGTIAALYVAAAIFLYVNQRSLLFFPQFTKASAQETTYTLKHGNFALRGWIVHPGKRRALIYFGGNAEPVQNARAEYARWAPDRTLYFVAYRGYGASDGEPSEAALFADALAVYDDVHAHHVDVAVVGRSLGSGVATWVASQRPLERLVLITPYDSVARVVQHRYPIFPVALMMHDTFESWRYAPAVRCPVLILEARDDLAIPPASTERLIQTFTPAPQVVRIDRGGHAGLQNDPSFVTAITDFLK